MSDDSGAAVTEGTTTPEPSVGKKVGKALLMGYTDFDAWVHGHPGPTFGFIVGALVGWFVHSLWSVVFH